MKTHGLFHFKQFSVSHARSTHKIGTDGVLLGAWVDTSGAKRILDVGTGSGVIALMLAQKSDADAHIDAVEIDEGDIAQAKENVANSPWPEKVHIHQIGVQDFRSANSYDIIVTNPPYFINSFLPPDEKRGKARHTKELSFESLLESTRRLLAASGALYLILPYQEGLHFQSLATAAGLYLRNELAFQSRKNKPIERLLMSFGFHQFPAKKENLVLYADGDDWSEEYRKLTKDFYLKA